ncbi:MAG: NFACT RNA binding domain-containing protein [Thermoanaerobaculia bacterium]|nr:NFACT RNA binding domain-containing protein [Thermoanaerobaculia bacterium]
MSSRPGVSPPHSDPDHGLWQGKNVARRFLSPDGLVILVGRTAADNDVLSLKIGRPRDFWMHIASGPGSHVVVRNPEKLGRLPRETKQMAAALAVRYSKGRDGGRSAVHFTTCDQVSKKGKMAPGKVRLGRYETVYAAPYSSDRA